MTESYFDIDGKPIGLAELCIREPGWAANRIRAMRATIDEIEGSPAPVEWVDGRAKVGDVTVQMSRWSGMYQGTELPVIHVARIEHGSADVHVEHPDEATAKRIAIAVAREMQR